MPLQHLEKPKGLPGLAFDEISANRMPRGFSGNRKTQTRIQPCTRHHEGHKILAMNLRPVFENLFELLRPGQSIPTGFPSQGTGPIPSGNQSMSSFPPARLEHGTALTGCHPGSKSVSPLAVKIARLKSAFHDPGPIIPSFEHPEMLKLQIKLER